MDVPQGYEAFIYDCDGTLVDSMDLHFRAWREAFASFGARFDFSWPVFLSRAGMGHQQTVIELNAQFGERLDPEQVAQRQRSAFRRMLDQVRPIEAVVAHARGVGNPAIQSVASGGEREVVERQLELVGIRDLFSFVVCSEDVRRGKPDPEMFLLCAHRMGVAPERCLVFEDGELGILAAQAAGMGFVRVISVAPD